MEVGCGMRAEWLSPPLSFRLRVVVTGERDGCVSSLSTFYFYLGVFWERDGSHRR
jgi:hypothetical protein